MTTDAEPAAWLECDAVGNAIGVSLTKDENSPFQWIPVYRALAPIPPTQGDEYQRLRGLIEKRIAGMGTAPGYENRIAQSELSDLLAAFDAGEPAAPSPNAQSELVEKLKEPRLGIHEDGTEELKTWEQLWEQCVEAAARIEQLEQQINKIPEAWSYRITKDSP